MGRSERGQSLLEVVIASAIVAVVTGACCAALLVATHRFGPDPVMQSLQSTVSNEMRVAVDLAKYQGTSIAATTIATTAPMPSSSPLAVHLSVRSIAASSGATSLSITATSDAEPSKSVTLEQTLAAPAPLPGSSIAGAAGAAPQ